MILLEQQSIFNCFPQKVFLFKIIHLMSCIDKRDHCNKALVYHFIQFSSLSSTLLSRSSFFCFISVYIAVYISVYISINISIYISVYISINISVYISVIQLFNSLLFCEICFQDPVSSVNFPPDFPASELPLSLLNLITIGSVLLWGRRRIEGSQ